MPQGSILGPLLFLIFINDLPDHVAHVLPLLFADDTKCLGSVHTVASNVNDLQLDLDSLSLWSLTNRLAFNVAKSAMLCFPCGSVPPPHFVSGVEIPIVSSTRDLGVLISSSLSWSDHISNITSKAYKMLGLVRRSFSNQLPVTVKKSLYLSLVRSHLLYCSVIWRPHLVKDILLLENIQRRATKYILNDFNLDYKSRLVSLNLLPLSMVFELNDILFFLKSLRSPSAAFNILDYVSFSNSSNTRSSSSHKLRHSRSSSTLSSHFYFRRLPRIWNRLPVFDIYSQSLSAVTIEIKSYFWSQFIEHFNTNCTCSWHISCPCSNCITSFSNFSSS